LKNIQKRKYRKVKVKRFTEIAEGAAYSGTTGLQLACKPNPIDIGALAYHVRQKDAAAWEYSVEKETLDSSRVRKLAKWVDCLAIQSGTGKRDTTLAAEIRLVFGFFDFCEQNGLVDFLKNKATAQNSYSEYSKHLTDRIRNNSLSNGTAGRRQQLIARFLDQCFDDPLSNFSLSVPRINTQSINPTEVPDDELIEVNLRVLKCLFESIHRHCIQFKQYPWKIDVGNGLEWVFPIHQWKAPAAGKTLKRYNAAYDYTNGRIRKSNEIMGFYTSKYAALNAVRSAKEVMERANVELRHSARIKMAMWAHDSFVLLFIAVTGMNLASVRQLLWNSSYKIEKDSILFRVIKYRSAGRQCEFKIQAAFMPLFRDYLDLRSFILGDKRCDYLFFSLGAKVSEVPTKISDDFTFKFSNKYRMQINPKFKLVGAREWRATKADQLLRSIYKIVRIR